MRTTILNSNMRIALFSIIIFHWAILCFNTLSFLLLPFLTFVGPDWLYKTCITVPVMSALGNLAVAPGHHCPLTRIAPSSTITLTMNNMTSTTDTVCVFVVARREPIVAIVEN